MFWTILPKIVIIWNSGMFAQVRLLRCLRGCNKKAGIRSPAVDGGWTVWD